MWNYCDKQFFLFRFDEDVINERTKSALELLNFIGGHQALFTCDPFLHFFHVSFTKGKYKFVVLMFGLLSEWLSNA